MFLHAQGTLGSVSMHMHLSAAFNNPCVVIAGAREPSWFTQYMGHQYLSTNGCLPCAETNACWKCKTEGCISRQEDLGMKPNEKVPACVDIIPAEEVIKAIEKYYEGGRLEYGKKIPNKFFKNIAKVSKPYNVKQPARISPPSIEKTTVRNIQMEWGGNEVTERDWEFLKKTI